MSKIYLDYFKFPNKDKEDAFLWDNRLISVYPFNVLSKCNLAKVEFEPVTVFYGGNGSGKSTALNVIAEKLGLLRDSLFNKAKFYPDYVRMCEVALLKNIPDNSRIITSDDVFDYMLNIRSLNENLDVKRDEVRNEYNVVNDSRGFAGFQVKTISDYDELKRINNMRKKTQTKFIKSEVMDDVREISNGESAFKYFTEKIEENGLYLLDEPENSLSPKRQLELKQFIEDSVRFFGCQFIISTHSPFLLSMSGTKIYNLDENPAKTKKWTELENVRIYRDFFAENDKLFNK